MRRHPNFTSQKAQAVLQRMLDRLALGPANTIEMIEASGKSGGRGREYLMHLRTIGRIRCSAEAVFSFDGSTPAVWELNEDWVESEQPDEEVCVVVRQQWAPHHERHWMDVALFGVPAALQGMVA